MSVNSHFSYKGLLTMQHEGIPSSFNKLIDRLRPKKVIEIGTASGGLSLLIRDLLNQNGLTDSDVITYDVNNPEYLQYHVENKSDIDVRIKNIFNHSYNDIVEKEEISEIFDCDGPILVLCDGGSKKNEFNLFSNYLRVGDVIMAHDYAKDYNFFIKNLHGKVWDWMEIQDSDIEYSCEKNNLKSYMQDDFTNVVWVCKIKES